ncbi:MAG: hypothetical protein ACJAZO_005384 [Myxococcota bacterium]
MGGYDGGQLEDSSLTVYVLSRAEGVAYLLFLGPLHALQIVVAVTLSPSETMIAADGYYAVILGVGASSPDTSVFLQHGAMALDIDVNGVNVGTSPLGGYPVVVAQQSLLAKEATVQQRIAGAGLSERVRLPARRSMASNL